jgi:hypothetical protein
MKEFLLIFRNDYSATAENTSPEKMQKMLTEWMNWMGSIAAQNKMVDKGSRLSLNGKTLRPNNVISDGPYTEVKELVGGYTIIKAASMEEAVELAIGCPILTAGGNVEIRNLVAMDGSEQ